MPGGGSWTAPVIERAELLDHRGDGRRLRIPRGVPETAVEVAIVRLERAIDDRSGLDVLDPDVPAGERGGEGVQHRRLRHGARGNDVLQVRQREPARDDALAEPREVQRRDAVPAMVDESLDRRVARLAAKPFDQEFEVLRLGTDDRAAQVVDGLLERLAEALRLPVDVERIVRIALDILAPAPRVYAVGGDLQDAGIRPSRELAEQVREARVHVNGAHHL